MLTFKSDFALSSSWLLDFALLKLRLVSLVLLYPLSLSRGTCSLASKVEMYYRSQTKKCLLMVQRLVLFGPS